MLNDHIDELVYENRRNPLFPDTDAASKSDELRSLGSFSVLSEPDRKIVEVAGRWLRHMWLEATPGYSMKLDGIDHDAVYDAMRQVEGLLTRTLPEQQLSRDRINAGECMCQRATCATCNKRHANQAHASETESVCSGCGGRTVNGFCPRRCE